MMEPKLYTNLRYDLEATPDYPTLYNLLCQAYSQHYLVPDYLLLSERDCDHLLHSSFLARLQPLGPIASRIDRFPSPFSGKDIYLRTLPETSLPRGTVVLSFFADPRYVFGRHPAKDERDGQRLSLKMVEPFLCHPDEMVIGTYETDYVYNLFFVRIRLSAVLHRQALKGGEDEIEEDLSFGFSWSNTEYEARRDLIQDLPGRELIKGMPLITRRLSPLTVEQLKAFLELHHALYPFG